MCARNKIFRSVPTDRRSHSTPGAPPAADIGPRRATTTPLSTGRTAYTLDLRSSGDSTPFGPGEVGGIGAPGVNVPRTITDEVSLDPSFYSRLPFTGVPSSSVVADDPGVNGLSPSTSRPWLGEWCVYVQDRDVHVLRFVRPCLVRSRRVLEMGISLNTRFKDS